VPEWTLGKFRLGKKKPDRLCGTSRARKVLHMDVYASALGAARAPRDSNKSAGVE
jgi:hypothetical protein